MTMKEIIILSYIHKFHRIDLAILQDELNMNVTEISKIILNLYDKNFIEYRTVNTDKRNSIYVKNVDNRLIDSWNIWTKDYNDANPDKSQFDWESLYIPKKFGKIE